MTLSKQDILDRLISSISTFNQVQSIGISGVIRPLPEAGEGDIDIFIYCDEVPEKRDRQEMLDSLAGLFQERKIDVINSEQWGIGDFVSIHGVETWLMYFRVDEVTDNMESILRGDFPEKLDGYYYPIGRLAMLKSINVMADKKGFLESVKEKLVHYPDSLAEVMIRYHLEKLSDREDLERARTRKDVLFYHFSLDLAIDHFLQVLFALNRVYFPSRKRSVELMKGFTVKPEKCAERLLDIVRLGASAEGIHESYALWDALVNDLGRLCLPIR